MPDNYDQLITASAARHNIDPRLLRAVLLRETGLGRDLRPGIPGDPDSPVGVAQMRPSTIRGLLGPNADPNDPTQAIDAAAAYLDQGVSKAEKAGIGNPGAYAVAHYFAGPDQAKWGPKTSDYVRGIATELNGIGYQPPPPTAGAAKVMADPPKGGTGVIATALREEGLSQNAPQIAEYLHNGGQNLDPRTTAWCAAFVNSTLAQHGIQGSGSLVATSFDKWGQPVTGGVQPGDVALLSRGLPAGATGGHVGFATGNTRTDPATGRPQIEMIAGNQRVDPSDPSKGHQVGRSWQDLDAVTLRRAPGDVASAYTDGALAATGGAPPKASPTLLPLAHAPDVTALPMGSTSGPLPTDWADVAGAPPSVRYAPPSLYTASDPETQARYQQASTPEGYAALQRVAAQGAPVTREALPPPPPAVPSPAVAAAGAPGTGSLDIAMLNAPEGLEVGAPSSRIARPTPMALPADWAAPAPAPAPAPQVPGPPRPTGEPGEFSYGGPATDAEKSFSYSGTAPPAPAAILPPDLANVSASAAIPPAPGPAMIAPSQGATAAIPPPIARMLSDEEIARMQPADVLGTVGREDLTNEDRAAIQRRLDALSQNLPAPPEG